MKLTPLDIRGKALAANRLLPASSCAATDLHPRELPQRPVRADIKPEGQGRERGRRGRTKVTRQERAEIIERTLERCDYLGALLVADEEILHRLLGHLGVDTVDRKVGDHPNP